MSEIAFEYKAKWSETKWNEKNGAWCDAQARKQKEIKSDEWSAGTVNMYCACHWSVSMKGEEYF